MDIILRRGDDGPLFSSLLRRAEGGFGANFLREGELMSYRDEESWVRVVPAGFGLIFLPFSWLLRRAKAFRRSCWLFF